MVKIVGNFDWPLLVEKTNSLIYNSSVTSKIVGEIVKSTTLQTKNKKQKIPLNGINVFDNNSYPSTNSTDPYIYFYQATNIPQELYKISEIFNIDYPRFIMNRQDPGSITIVHIDGYPKYHHSLVEKNIINDLANIDRLAVACSEYEIGHFWQIENNIWKDWHIGDIIYGDLYSNYHCTGNAGFSPRFTLLIDGIFTDKTYKLIEEYTKIIL